MLTSKGNKLNQELAIGDDTGTTTIALWESDIDKLNQEVAIGDDTGTTTIALWESDIDTLLLNHSCELSRVQIYKILSDYSLLLSNV